MAASYSYLDGEQVGRQSLWFEAARITQKHVLNMEQGTSNRKIRFGVGGYVPRRKFC